MNDKIQLFIFIDALGWHVVQRHPFFLDGLIIESRPLGTILGYSSACDPSIISGLDPAEHGHWSSFYFSSQRCPYQWVRWLNFIPRFLTDHHRVRHQLSKMISSFHGFTGYFQIYNVPFKYLSLFDYAEKQRIWVKGGLLKGRSIFDALEERGASYYVGDQHSEELQLGQVSLKMETRSIQLAYLLFGKLDALMHKYGNAHESIGKLLVNYDRRIREIFRRAKNSYGKVELFVFSDHGMHNVTGCCDLVAAIDATGLQYGQDYVSFYDSTMARFWFLKESARSIIVDCLIEQNCGTILSEEQLKKFGVYFPDHQYGELIFLMNPALLIVPSFMGLKPLQGMHGYHPDDEDSKAMIMSNCPLPKNFSSIKDIAKLVFEDEMALATI